MLKKYMGLLILCVFGMFLQTSNLEVNASEESAYVTVTESIAVTNTDDISNKTYNVTKEDTTVFSVSCSGCIENILIILDEGVNISKAVFLVNTGTISLKNIQIIGKNISGRLIQVENGASVTIDGFEANVNTDYLIRNRGLMTIKNFTYTGTSTYGIDNNTENFVLEKTNIDKILLNSGACITVNENTELENNITITLGSNFCANNCIVKGDKIFASYFMDKFSLTSTTFCLEYFGSTDNAVSSQIKNIPSLNTGDIFLVEKEKNTNIVVNAYATGVNYVTEKQKTITYESSLYESTLVLDNYNMVSLSNLKSSALNKENVVVTLSVKNGETTTTYTMGKNGSWLIFLENADEDMEISTSNNLSTQTIYTCKSHSAILVTHSGENLSAELNVVLNEVAENPTEPEETTKPIEPTAVTINTSNTTFTYNGLDHFNEVEVTYIFNESTYTLTCEQTEIKNAGNYSIQIIFNEDSENYGLVELDKTSIEVAVLPKEISINFSQTSSTYTKEEIYVNAEAIGLATGDECNISLENATQTNAGTYTVTASIQNENYKIADASKTYSFVIEKATIDESKISFEDIHKIYDGVEILFANSCIYNNLIYVEYVNKENIIVNSGTYIVNISTCLLDTNNYYPLSKTQYSINVQINKREIYPSLKTDTFEYSNATPNLEISFDNVLEKDEVNYTLKVDKNIYVGEYFAEVILNETSNYFIPNSYSKLEYTITPKLVDTSMAIFEDKCIYYGDEICFEVSNLPSGITVRYLNTSNLIVGTHKIFASLQLEDTYNYKLDRTTISMTLTVLHKEIDISTLKLTNKKYVYDGNLHSLDISEISLENIKITSPKQSSFMDVGEYIITYTLSPINTNYKLIGKEDLSVSGTLKITPADYNISDISFKDLNLVYDTLPHTITYTGTLPTGLSVLPTEEFVNAGTYTITLSFVNTNSNYITPANKTATLTIEPKEVFVSLKEDTFVYTGNAVTLAYNITGVLNTDQVDIQLSYPTSIDAKEYEANILNIANPNYFCSTTALSYTITKAPSNISNLTFPSISFTYTGEAYTPKIYGTMPSYLSYQICYEGTIKNTGTYEIYAKFTADKNHIAPDDLRAVVTITPKPVTVSFKNYTDLKYTGNPQYIGIEITGMVDQEEIHIKYSETPLEAGNYTCRVSLNEKSNYIITGDDTCVFNIYLEKKTTENDDYKISIEGGLFDTTSDLSVHSLALSQTNKETLLNTCENLDTYECFEIHCDTKSETLSYELSLNSLNLSSGNYTLYHLSNSGKLTELSYTLSGNTISFTAPTNSTFILAKEKTHSALPLYLILLSTIIFISLAIILAKVLKTRKKKN